MRRRSEETHARLLETFRSEAEEHLQAIDAALAELAADAGANGRAPAAETLFRAVHTLKGAARSVALVEVEQRCQTLEALLSRIVRGEIELTRPLFEQLQESADDLARILDADLTAPSAPGEVPSAAADRLGEPRLAPSLTGDGAPHAGVSIAEHGPRREAAEPGARAGTIRVAVAQLDALLFQTEDLLLSKLAAGERLREIRAITPRLDAWVREHAGAAGAELRPLEGELRELTRRLRTDLRRLERLHGQLQSRVLHLRTSPVGEVVDSLPRMARDLAREEEKEVELTLEGADLEMDRRVLERVKDPLIHLVRNAVDHGIETPESRERAGKPRRGRITVSFRNWENRRIEVTVRDDGAGVGLDAVRGAAVRARVLTSTEAESLESEAALDLLFRSGFSTSPVVTRVSGHGLGLPIVRERVESIGGELEIESRPGVGTTVRLLLPAAIATIHGLLLLAAGQPFLIPLESAERVLRVSPGDIVSVEGRPAILHGSQVVPLASLASLLELPAVPRSGRRSRRPCVMLRSGHDRAGLLVDEVLGERELLVKELEAPLARIRHVAAAGVLGTGALALILRPPDLIRSVVSARDGLASESVTRARSRTPVILVVDDSITTRIMERNLLENAGFQVRLAVDGMEAWTLLKSEPCDLVVSDVDMQRMDGFALTERIRADASLRELPVVLVTAMELREHRERGVLAGANAYVIKSSFEESNLLEIIRRLV